MSCLSGQMTRKVASLIITYRKSSQAIDTLNLVHVQLKNRVMFIFQKLSFDHSKYLDLKIPKNCDLQAPDWSDDFATSMKVIRLFLCGTLVPNAV